MHEYDIRYRYLHTRQDITHIPYGTGTLYQQLLLPEVKAWWSERHLPVSDDDLLSDLEAAVRNAEDGYARAHWLHQYRGWMPNTKLVTILD